MCVCVCVFVCVHGLDGSEDHCEAPTSVHGPTPKECSITVNTPAMTSCMFPWDLENSC